MAIEVSEAGTTISGEDVKTFAVLAVAHGLALEINTGLRGRSLDGARNHGLIAPNGRSKKAALKAAIKRLKEIQPQYEPSSSIKKALGL